MFMVDVLLLIVSLVVGFLLVGATGALLVRARLAKTRQVLERRVRGDGDFVQHLDSVRYSGADFGYSKVKNNGVLVVGGHSLYFQHFIEKTPSIVLPLANLQDVTLEASFRGELPTLSGGGFLVLYTTDNNRIGFLLKSPEVVQRKIFEIKNQTPATGQ